MGRRLLYCVALVGTAAAQTAGDIKLVNGRTAGAYDGLLQVYYNIAWYSVCDDNFSDEHVALICQQLFGTPGWVSWTTDLGHCYTPVTGPTLNLEYTHSSFYYSTVDDRHHVTRPHRGKHDVLRGLHFFRGDAGYRLGRLRL